MSAVEIVGHVWLVTERPATADVRVEPHIFGIYETEKAARDEYGEADDAYTVTFEELPLWGVR